MAVKERLATVPVIGTALAVQERYKADAADPLASAIAFFAFLSLFPLLLLTVSLAGFVLEDPDDQVAVVTAITEAIPGFEATLEDGEDDTAVADLVSGVVEQRGTIGGIGLVLILFSGLRVINAAMVATRVVFRGNVLKGVGIKVRQVGALVGLGVLALLGVAGSSVAGTGLAELPDSVAVLLSLAISFALDLLLFLGAYTLLSPTSRITARQTLPGAVLGAAGWTALKVAGSSYVGNQMEDANALYGALGGVIALMLLFYLAGRLYLYGAELTAVRVERRHGPLTPPVQEEDAHDAGGDVTDTPAEPSDEQRAAAELRAVPAATPRPVAEPTRERLAVADQLREAQAQERDRGEDTRRAVGFAVGLAALVAAWRFLGPGRE